MNGRLLDRENDIYTEPNGDGTFRIARAATFRDRTMRLVGTVLRTFQGECFTNRDAGIPWFDDILGNQANFTDEIAAELKEKILQVEGVEGVEGMTVKTSGRNVSGSYSLRLSNGSIENGDF